MAKYSPGPVAGAISGGVGNVVFTRGRFGPVMRVRAFPVFGPSTYRDDAKQLLADVMAQWKTLTDDERTAWDLFAELRPEPDRLGCARALSGPDLFCRINCRALWLGGDLVRVPSAAAAPAHLDGVSVIATSAPSVVSVSWTSGDVDANHGVQWWAAVLTSPGKRYYKNLLKMVIAQEGVLTTPVDIGSYVETRFQALVAGDTVKVHTYVVSKLTGYRSGVSVATAVVDA